MGYAAAIKDLKSSLNTNKYAKCIIQLKDLANAGNSAACEIYGDMLMEGVWNIYQMKSDIIKNKLIEPVEYPEKDAYLLLPRDPVAAIEYYEKASGNRDTALAKLEHCKKMGYAGLPKVEGYKIDPLVKITSKIEEFLDKNAKPGNSVSSVAHDDLEASKKFVAVPDCRPEIHDPRISLFKKMADNWGCNSAFQFILIELVIMVVSLFNRNYTLLDTFNLMAYGAAVFGIPLIGYSILCVLYAESKGVPLCSCFHMQAAYENSLKGYENFSGEIESEKTSPFETTSFFVRNLNKVKQVYLWTLFLLAIILLITYDAISEILIKLPVSTKYGMRSTVIIGIMIIPFVIVIFWEKRFQKIPKYFGYDTTIFKVYLMMLCAATFFAPWTLFDKDCCHEFEISKYHRIGFEKDIMDLED